MFEIFLEKELQRQVEIINILWEGDSVNSTKLAASLKITPATVKADVKRINYEYCSKDNPLIISSPLGYSIQKKNKKTKKKYLKRIYASSLFIKATCFFLKNNLSHIEELQKLENISQAKAYNLKKRVIKYLESLGIVSGNTFAENTEIRIRFLMAYFQWELGIQAIDIPIKNYYLFQCLFDEVEKKRRCILSKYSKSYAVILFQINLMRREENPVYFSKEEITFIKETQTYKQLREEIKLFLEMLLNVCPCEEDILYFSLVFNIMNANYYDKSPDTYEIFKNSPSINYKVLVKSFEEEFEVGLSDCEIFEHSILTFLRKCVLNLQPFIPEEHNTIEHITNVPEEMLNKVENALRKWNCQTNQNLTFSKLHIKQLSTKLFFIFKKRKRPKFIYLLTSFHIDYLLAKEILTHEYGAIVEVKRFDPTKRGAYLPDDLILCDMDYPILGDVVSKKLEIDYVFDLQELQKIRELLFEYEF